MSNHRHQYYIRYPRGFANEYSVYAVPEGEIPATPDTTKMQFEGVEAGEALEPVDCERITRKQALRKARKTPKPSTIYHVTVNLCPECEGDAFQVAFKRQEENRSHMYPRNIFASRVHDALQNKGLGSPPDRPWSVEEDNDG